MQLEDLFCAEILWWIRLQWLSFINKYKPISDYIIAFSFNFNKIIGNLKDTLYKIDESFVILWVILQNVSVSRLYSVEWGMSDELGSIWEEAVLKY
jgi:hypothetical protein